MPLQQLPVHSRLVVEAFQVGLGDQLHQVAVAPVIPGQHREVVGALVGGEAVAPAARGHVQLTPDDGLDARLQAGGVELHHAVHSAVVRDRQGRHPQLTGAPDQGLDSAHAVQQAVLGMKVQVGEHARSRKVPWLAQGPTIISGGATRCARE